MLGHVFMDVWTTAPLALLLLASCYERGFANSFILVE